MSVRLTLENVWRKNAPELVGLLDGALPDFVTRRQPEGVPNGIPVFCYHLVEAAGFEADLIFLRDNGYRTLSGSEFAAFLEGRFPITGRAVLLTFDDGPRNFYDVAFPLLRKYAARALAFVAPGLHRQADTDGAISERPMDWRELYEVYASGLLELQSHTLESRYVPRWPSPAALVGCEPALEQARRSASPLTMIEDFAQARTMLEHHIPGSTVNQMSFPMYLGTEEAVEIARHLGFVACYWGYRAGRPLNRAGDSPFFISRISDEFLRRLPGKGRISVTGMLFERLRRIRLARSLRQRQPSGTA